MGAARRRAALQVAIVATRVPARWRRFTASLLDRRQRIVVRAARHLNRWHALMWVRLAWRVAQRQRSLGIRRRLRNLRGWPLVVLGTFTVQLPRRAG